MSEEADKGFEKVWQSARQDGGGTCGLQSQRLKSHHISET